MISVSAALQRITENITPLPAATMPLQLAAGKVLAEDVFASIDIPAYPQSSMDGYAFAFDHVHQPLHITGEMAAGAAANITLAAGNAMRIFTGAPVPAGADTVVMQEKVRIENGQLLIEDEQLQRSANVRAAGSEIQAGALALPKGSLLTAAAIGFLAGIGIAHVSVIPNPIISIILTGNELQTPGNALQYGQVYESNSYSLTAALEALHLPVFRTYTVTDNLDALTNTLAQALHDSDVVLLTGGVSVGDYDFVLQAVQACDITTQFHKVKQKPGKPLYFGTKEQQLVFGLPGNPSSVLTCFYIYVCNALAQLTLRPLAVPHINCTLAADSKKAAGLTHFQKATYADGKVQPLAAQESYKLQSFAVANCLLELPEESTGGQTGDTVRIHLLPQ